MPKSPFALGGGEVAPWLVCSSSDRAVWVGALGSVIVLCSWARQFTLTVPLTTQVSNRATAKLNAGDVTLQWTSISSRWNRNTPSCFMLHAKIGICSGLIGHLVRVQT